MLVDHIGVVFFPGVLGWRLIGRISFPLFVWLLVQGEAHTRNGWRYGVRLALLGVISQPLYQLAFETSRLNILFELLIGLICLRLVRLRSHLQPLIWLVGIVISILLDADYGAYGIGLIALTRYFQPTLLWWIGWIGLHLFWAGLTSSLLQLPVIAIPLLFQMANGQRGPQARWFYIFYPAHLAVLALLDRVWF